jgi:flagellar protein FliS
MYSPSKGIASYGRIAHVETNPLKQVVMLYDGAIKFLNMTAVDIETGDISAKGEHSGRALEILCYLQSILNFELGGDVAVSLDNLYRSIINLILRASAELDPQLMRKAAELLSPVRDAWEENSRESASPIETRSSVTLPPLASGYGVTAA